MIVFFYQFRIYIYIYIPFQFSLFNLDDFFFQIFPSAIVSSLRMTLFKSLEGQKQQKQHSQARNRKRGACEVGNCFNIQIPGWGFPPVPSQLFYHSQAFELFTFWCSDVLVLETGISQSLWLQPDGQDSLKFQPHKVSFFFIFFCDFWWFQKNVSQYYLSGFGSSASLFW